MYKSKKKVRSLSRTVVAAGCKLSHVLFDSYHPERYYMRGPGPKWREKHGLLPEGQVHESAAQALKPVHV